MLRSMGALQLQGFEILTGMFTLDEIQGMMRWIPSLENSAGTRNLLTLPQCRKLAANRNIMSWVGEDLGPNSIPIRAILFDKNASTNWNLGWHQDKKIALSRRIEVEGFSAWSEKEGVSHCQPPAWVLEQCLAVRIHLDPCGMENGPLRAIPGSHLSGLRPGPDSAELLKEVICTTEIGDVILMKPLTFHASSKALTPSHRRVIHIEFSSAKLPGGLAWQVERQL